MIYGPLYRGRLSIADNFCENQQCPLQRGSTLYTQITLFFNFHILLWFCLRKLQKITLKTAKMSKSIVLRPSRKKSQNFGIKKDRSVKQLQWQKTHFLALDPPLSLKRRLQETKQFILVSFFLKTFLWHIKAQSQSTVHPKVAK